MPSLSEAFTIRNMSECKLRFKSPRAKNKKPCATLGLILTKTPQWRAPSGVCLIQGFPSQCFVDYKKKLSRERWQIQSLSNKLEIEMVYIHIIIN